MKITTKYRQRRQKEMIKISDVLRARSLNELKFILGDNVLAYNWVDSFSRRPDVGDLYTDESGTKVVIWVTRKRVYFYYKDYVSLS